MEEVLNNPGKDWFLTTLNTIVNNNVITIGVTIVTHGFIVSGHLTGGREYFDAVANEFATTLNSSFKIENSFQGLADTIYGSDNPEVKDGPLASDYIHIKNARFYNSASEGILPNNPVWWRGRISEISGFSIGVINDTKE